jgi:hypothetical protein
MGMGRAAGVADITARRQRFDELFGAGRGLSEPQKRERECEDARATAPHPFVEQDPDSEYVTRYYLGNDPQAGILHRNGGPAVEYASGTRLWYCAGELHREDGPAYEDTDGSRAWYLEGRHHRDDGPAVEDVDGYRAWFRRGPLHRDGGPAVEHADWRLEWWVDGQRQYSTWAYKPAKLS